MVDIIMAITAAAGGFLQSSTGFGYSLICMSVYSLVLPIKTALIVQALAAVFVIGYYAFRQRKYINFKLFAIPAVFSLVTCYGALQIVYLVDDDILKKVLGISFILLPLFSLLSKNKLKMPKGFIGMAVAGSISGLLGGLTNMSGPPMVIYLLGVTDDKNEYNGTIQAFFIVNSLFKTIINAASGMITLDIVKMLPLLLITTGIGSIFGFKLFHRMNMDSIKKMVNIVMIFVGLYYTIF